MEVSLPIHTAGDVKLPDATVVWVQTINSVARAEAAKAADLYTAREMRPYRVGGEAYEDKLAFYADIEAQVQADYIARQRTYEYAAESFKQYPEPIAPERRDAEDDESFGKRVDAHDKAKDKALKSRLAHIEKRQAEEREKVAAMEDTLRAAECYRLWRQETHRETFEHRFHSELLARVVRKSEDHAMLVYSCEHTHADGRVSVRPDADAVAALDDATRGTLIDAYARLDPIQPAQVPTSPPALAA